MIEEQHDLTISSRGKDLEISNGKILVRFIYIDGGYASEFYAVDSKRNFHLILSSIQRNLILSSEHRASSSPMISGERPHLFALCRDSLRMTYTDADIYYRDQQKIVVRLIGAIQEHSLVSDITIEADSNIIHIDVEDTISSGASKSILEYLMSSYAFLPDGHIMPAGRELDYSWAPNLRPLNDNIIGDRMFHSPAVIVQQGHLAGALIPDMDILRDNRPIPTALDLDLTNGMLFAPLLSYGFCDYEKTGDGRYCRHDITMSRHLPNSTIRYGHYLILDADCKRKSAGNVVTHFLWDKYGKSLAKQQVLNNKRIVESCQSSPSPQPSHTGGRSSLYQARTAYGLYAEGARTHNGDLINQAREIRDNILSLTQYNELFPTWFDQKRGKWRNCEVSAEEDSYSSVECSTQLYWLLKMNNDLENDGRIIPFCRHYADYLIESKLRSGAIPSWFSKDGQPLLALRSSAQTAASVLFLAELAQTTGLKMYLHACEQSARFILNDIIPHQNFLDFTCIEPEISLSFECIDPHTGMRPAGTHAMLWTAQMCMELYKLLDNPSYLKVGEEILDSLCLTQSVCDMPWISDSNAFGLIMKNNTGSQPDPELSAEFARCVMQYGAITGKCEYFERGTAALKAAMNSECNARSEAAVAASAAAVKHEMGSVFVHGGKKWGLGAFDYKVERLQIRSNRISININGNGHSNGTGRVVFGGLKGSTYRVTINGQCKSYDLEDLKTGILISGQHC